MIRKIIKIDEEKCNGCGACAAACHEGAIGMVNGKAKLLRDDYCDGLGDCLPVCPTDAISFEEREAAAYDKDAVEANQKAAPLPCGCPGTHVKSLAHKMAPAADIAPASSELAQWPVQIQLVPVNAPYFENANLLIAADCTAFAYGNFHHDFMKGHVTLIGCPKLDAVEYTEKLTEIIRQNNVKSVKIIRMEVPCCGGIEHAAKSALQQSGKFLPWQVITVSTEGSIIE